MSRRQFIRIKGLTACCLRIVLVIAGNSSRMISGSSLGAGELFPNRRDASVRGPDRSPPVHSGLSLLGDMKRRVSVSDDGCLGARRQHRRGHNRCKYLKSFLQTNSKLVGATNPARTEVEARPNPSVRTHGPVLPRYSAQRRVEHWPDEDRIAEEDRIYTRRDIYTTKGHLG